MKMAFLDLKMALLDSVVSFCSSHSGLRCDRLWVQSTSDLGTSDLDTDRIRMTTVTS